MQSGIPTVIFIGSLGLLTLAVMLIILLVKLHEQNKIEKLLIQTAVAIREQSFQMVSEELHDNIGQLLSLAKIQLSMIQNRLEKDALSIDRLQQTLTSVSTGLREMAAVLNGNPGTANSLTEMVQQMVVKINQCEAIMIHQTVQGHEQQLSEQVKFIAYRIVQEAVQNTLKHGRAKHIFVHFVFDKQALELTIKDNGDGFDVADQTKKRGGKVLKIWLHAPN